MKVYLDIRRLRLEHNWSLRDLSKISGVSKSALSKYENGLSEPTISNYVKIAKAFRIRNITNELLKVE